MADKDLVLVRTLKFTTEEKALIDKARTNSDGSRFSKPVFYHIAVMSYVKEVLDEQRRSSFTNN